MAAPSLEETIAGRVHGHWLTRLASHLDEFERTEAGYICLAQYMARAITLGIFGHKLKSMIPAPSVAAPAAAGPKPAEPQR